MYNRSFRYALKWVGPEIQHTTKVHPKFDNVDQTLNKINNHISNLDPNYPGITTSHEILIKKKVSLHKYLVAICCQSSLSTEVIHYVKEHYPNVKILKYYPSSATELYKI